MKPSDKFMTLFQNEFLHMTSSHLKAGIIDLNTAKEAAKLLISFLPFTSYEDLEHKLKTLSDRFPVYGKLYLDMLKIIEENKTSQLINKMRSLMKENQLDDVVNVT